MAKKTARVTRKPKKGSRNFTPWTPADEKKLRKLAGKMPTEKVAKTLNVSLHVAQHCLCQRTLAGARTCITAAKSL